MNKEKDQLLKDSLQALKDIFNAAEGGEPYTAIEICAIGGFVHEILNRKTSLGIELDGESFASHNATT